MMPQLLWTCYIEQKSKTVDQHNLNIGNNMKNSDTNMWSNVFLHSTELDDTMDSSVNNASLNSAKVIANNSNNNYNTPSRAGDCDSVSVVNDGYQTDTSGRVDNQNCGNSTCNIKPTITNNNCQETVTTIQEQPRPESIQILEPNDPYLMTQQRITPLLISTQLNLGPLQPSPSEYHYPKTQRLVRATSESLLCFNASWYERKLSDGSTQPRLWLSYSKWLNKAFCVYCMLFGSGVTSGGSSSVVIGGGGIGGSNRLSEAWTKTGWDTWNNGSRDIKRHEESSLHRAAELAKVRAMATVTYQRLQQQQGINPATSAMNALVQVNSEIVENRKAVKAVMDYLLLCCGFQTDSERVSAMFSRVVQMMAQYDPQLIATVLRVRHAPGESELDFTVHQNRQRLTGIICETISERLAHSVRRRRSFCLILETVSMASVDGRTTCGILWLRYLSGDSTYQTDINQGLLDIITLNANEAINEKVLKTLHKFGLDESNMAAFCCHANSTNSFVDQLGHVRVWPPPSGEILALVLESCASNECDRLTSCLGIVQQVAAFWTHSVEREQFLCEFLNRPVGSIGSGGMDDILDLLVDRYQDIIKALSQLKGSMKLGPMDAWIVDSLTVGLDNKETEEGISFLCRLVGMLRPAFSCQQLGKVHFLQQMRSRLAAELRYANYGAENMESANFSTPPEKVRKTNPDVKCLENEKLFFLRNVDRLVRQLYSDRHLQLISELSHFTSAALDSHIAAQPTPLAPASNNITTTNTSLLTSSDQSNSILTEQSIGTVCQLARLDPRAVLRELTDFRPIYREHKAAVLRNPQSGSYFSINGSLASENQTPTQSFAAFGNPIFPGESNHSDTSSLFTETFLLPLKLVSEFTSFPALLTLYKMLTVLPIFELPSQWTSQRLQVLSSLQHCRSIDEFSRCALLLTSLSEQPDKLINLPIEPVIDKIVAHSPALRKALCLPR